MAAPSLHAYPAWVCTLALTHEANFNCALVNKKPSMNHQGYRVYKLSTSEGPIYLTYYKGRLISKSKTKPNIT